MVENERGMLSIVIKAAQWAVLAVVGAMSFIAAGWVPVELAAMLASRRSAKDDDDLDVEPTDAE